MSKKTKNKVDVKSWKFWLPLSFGIFIIINNLIWIIINGGRWFEPYDPSGPKPEYYNDLNRVFGPVFMLFYFTIQTNLFLAAMFLFIAFKNKSILSNSLFVGSCVLITITFILYWAAIAPFSKWYTWQSAYFVIHNVFIHAINPFLGFGYLIAIRKDLIVNKRILGKCFFYVPCFLISNAILYGVGAIVDPNDPSKVNGAAIYDFIDLQKILFIDLVNYPWLAWIINLIVILLSPLLPTIISFIWLHIIKVKYDTKNSYYHWIDFIKKKDRMHK